MTDVPFATVSGDASIRPLHPSRSCGPAPTRRSNDTLFAAAHYGRFWPLATDFAPQPNVRFSAESDTTEKQRPLVYKLRWAGCGARAANSKEYPPGVASVAWGVTPGAHWGVGTPEMSMASEYTTRVSGGFRQAGNNVAMSRALLSVGTLIRAPGRPALTRRSQSGFFSSSSSLHRSLNWFAYPIRALPWSITRSAAATGRWVNE